MIVFFFFFSSRRRHTRSLRDWSSDVCSSDLGGFLQQTGDKMSKSKGNVTRVTELADQGFDPLAFRLLCFGVRYRNEMDFSWEALESAQTRLRRLRQRVADWSRADRPAQLSPAAAELDRRFRDAVADDLDFPGAV